MDDLTWFALLVICALCAYWMGYLPTVIILRRAETALKPFARIAEAWPDDLWPDDYVIGDGYTQGITLGDCRRARAALEGK